ncbi:GntR family transcriptional regulator [Fulvimarina sp. MAC8]|uniref:GntR family transcriptional regulator n=1 Tax=Fulvimarina sp. MAC8 TaxID=3162874 RepID=UPI0032EE86FD
MPERLPEALRRPAEEPHANGRPGSLRRFAYERIEDLLNTGQLQPGQLVTQRELVEATGATLGSVRESVPRFEAEGLLVTVPQKGLMVPSIDVAFVREAYQLRRMIELSAVSDMIARLRLETVEAWLSWHHEQAAVMTKADGPADPGFLDQLQRQDWAMHTEFVASIGNRLVDNVYRVTAIKIRMAVQSRLQVTGENASRVIREHLAILEALKARNADATAAALDRHIENSLTLALGGRPVQMGVSQL